MNRIADVLARLSGYRTYLCVGLAVLLWILLLLNVITLDQFIAGFGLVGPMAIAFLRKSNSNLFRELADAIESKATGTEQSE